MKPKDLYLLLCVAGTALPYSQLVPFVREHGLDLRLFFEQLFSTVFLDIGLPGTNLRCESAPFGHVCN
jgi:hypothetical protein